MPSGKREIERKGNALVNTGPLPNSDGRVNNLGEEADEPAEVAARYSIHTVDGIICTITLLKTTITEDRSNSGDKA
ncbi:hypothetical protein T4D_3900 [Trichinella pseudospiralis]|uniref:Uncharacterized protein n=1 Tax=Trichinella pseudospiralis TaxID=6337 RepID=A0A0V1FRF7_TRIPS|nr:hypothetical protein T4D_3900 [Trichinella pseudospiralis]